MKITPVLWTAHKSKDLTYPIYIKVNIGQKRKLIPVGIKIKESDWDNRNKRVKAGINSQAINLKILEMLNTLEKNILQSGSISTGDKTSLYYWFEEYINVCKVKYSSYHTRKIGNVMASLKEFKDPIHAHEIDSKLLRDYESYLLNKGLHRNYISDILRRFKFIVRQMVDAGVIAYHKNPFNGYKIKFVKTEKERLSYEDILKLQKVKLTGPEKLARDIYIVSFYGGGIRFGDCCRLSKANFEGNRLKYTMHKTSSQKNIELNPIALKIMKSYDYQFPTGIDGSDESIATKGTALRSALKEACRLARIKEVTFHTSRNSIADYAIKKKISHKGIQGILGHKQSSTTEAYLKSFYQEETDEAMDKLFS